MGIILAATLILAVSSANGQSISTAQEAGTSVVNSSESNTATTQVPVFKDYRGIKIGMSADEVHAKLERIKKGNGQDFLVVSDRESAQIYYDDKGKVMAISIDYFGDDSNAPSADAVLGMEIAAKADGSMYHLKRYPEAGYWVSYNRTAGDKPIVTITMQKM